MKTAVIICAWNEADIIEQCLQHWQEIGQGTVQFYLCDNGSNDNTWAVMQKYHPKELVLRQQQIWDNHTTVNKLKDIALSDGCKWIFPADADEFLQLPDGLSLPQWLRKFSATYPAGHLPYFNVFPNARIQQRPQMKVFGAFTTATQISIGNHTLDAVGGCAMMAPQTIDAYYDHFPFRSPDQMAAKIHRQAEMFRRIDPKYRLCKVQDVIDTLGPSTVRRLWEDIEAIRNEEDVPWWVSGQDRKEKDQSVNLQAAQG